MDDRKVYKVYALKSPDGKMYIGMTRQPISLRCRKDGYNGCPAMEKAILEYGWDSFTTEVLIDNLTKSQAELFEKEFIEQFDTVNPDKGFNVALGGNIEGRHSSETIAKMSQSQKGRVFSKEHLERLQKPKLNGALRRKVYKYTLSGVLVEVYDSVKQASEIMGVSKVSIIQCCNHKNKTCKGFKLEYGGVGT